MTPIQDRIGQQLGNYQLTRLIGKGGYAEVYLAKHTFLEVEAAVKVLKSRTLRDDERELFRFEARLVKKLHHPHIIEVQDFGIEVNKYGVDGSTPFLVMEYAPLGTLRTLYPHGTKVPHKKIVSYVKQVADALQYAHNFTPGIVHRDIKPENMLIKTPDEIVLSDFGIAVAGLNTGNLAEQIRHLAMQPDDLTVAGTAAYIAPERLQGHTQRASDQYSLGVVVYEWLTGYRPFNGTDVEVCLKHAREAVPPLSAPHLNIAPEIEDVVMRALEKDPRLRYPSVKDFADAFEAAVLKVSGQQQQSGSGPHLQQQSTSDPIKQQQNSSGPHPQQQSTSDPLKQQQGGSGPHKQEPNPVYEATVQREPGPWYNKGYMPIDPPDDTTEDLIDQGGKRKEPEENELIANFKGLWEAISKPFEFDLEFLKTSKLEWFRWLGILLNISSGIIIGTATDNWWLWFGGTLWSMLMFLFCITAVRKPLASTAGVCVAFWWYYVGAIIDQRLFSKLQLPEVIAGLVFFIVSVGLHIWYAFEKSN